MWTRKAGPLMLALALMLPPMAGTAFADGKLETVATSKTFAELQSALEAAVTANEMIVVSRACASCGAAKRGVTIPGNMVVGVYRNDFAVRMLEASVPAGIEAPIRFYLTENDDGTASLSYRLPSTVFTSYGSEELDGMARELDVIWAKIVEGATK
ncbi:MAG: DUF302 domain-containing protein [Alphaproteobacteria bacterium]|nr:DUF302 domain-containing protein [Alphaproteobacteria bacterium]